MFSSPRRLSRAALAADTGAPIPHASVSVGSSINPFWPGGGRRFPADQEGRFMASVLPGQYYSISAYPPEGQPYLIPDHRFEWNKGAVKRAIDIKLPRGVLIQGKVVEHGTGLGSGRRQYPVQRHPPHGRHHQRLAGHR